jgi:hypothetical protein
MNQIGRILIYFGIILIIVGILLSYGSKYIKFGKLPGDIKVEKENFRFYFPLTTSIVLSLILTFLFWIINRFK